MSHLHIEPFVGNETELIRDAFSNDFTNILLTLFIITIRKEKRSASMTPQFMIFFYAMNNYLMNCVAAR